MDGSIIIQSFNQVEAPGRRPRGRPKKTWKECVIQDIAEAGVQETAAADRAVWKTVIKRLTPSQKGQPDAKRKSKKVSIYISTFKNCLSKNF